MTDHSALIERLENGADRFLKWTYKHHYSGPPVVSIPRHPDNIDALLHEAAATLRDLTERLDAANQSICAFAAPWAATYARDFGLPEGSLHATHFDILEAAGARMVSFTRHVPSAPNQAKEAGE